MAGFGFYRKVLVFIFIVLGGCANAIADDNPCTVGKGSLGTAQCKAEKLKSLEKELDADYQEALGKLPDSSEWDIRQTKAQLEKSQRSWLVYRNENCSYVGGLQGGSNIWVTIFADDCAIEETERRIVFFKNLPTGG